MRKQYITAQELAEVVGISVANAYLRIKEMNDELKKQGFQTISGKIPLKYAKEKFYGVDFFGE